MSKKNSFDDFIACAEHLIDNGYTTHGQLGILGESAGGLLVGAVLNERPELFTAAVADCPFVDVLNTLLDPTLPLSASDWKEFGDPREKEAHEYIASYSPYENVRKQAYPAIYATAGFNDPRVSYWEPAKWIARLRDRTTGESPVLLEVNPEAGHWGSSQRFGYFEEMARKYAFLLSWLPA
jgi:oligopeptidase B